MGTKLKNSKPCLIWLCFLIGVNIVAVIGILGLVLSPEIYRNFDEFCAILRLDIKDIQDFKIFIANRFDFLARYINNDANNIYSDEYQEYPAFLDIEGENLIYYAMNPKTQKILTNSKNYDGILVDEVPSLPEGYDYLLYYDGKKFIAEKDKKPLDIYQKDSGYGMTALQKYINSSYKASIPDIEGYKIFLMVKQDIIKNPYANSSLYSLKNSLQTARWLIIILAAVFLLGIVLLVISLTNWKIKKEYDKRVAHICGAVWLEIKVLISFFVLILLAQILLNWDLRGTGEFFVKIITASACCWWFYLMFIDFNINRRRFFTNNSINSVIKLYRSFERKKPFQRAMLLRAYVFIAAEIILVLLIGTTSLLLLQGHNQNELLIFLLLAFISAAIYLAYRYFRRYSNTINDIGKVVDQIESIKNGDTATKLLLDPDADMYFAAQNLKRIQEGISKAVEEKIKSECMKMELITNVSHDLKTPLTSIISYVDLLSKEKGLPQHINDYIKILSNKSGRLKALIEDLFDLSKAASGNMQIEKEKLDLGKLIQQTLADLDEKIQQSELFFKVNIPQQPIYIISDGKRLYRVFLNLISNALKYSLAGSRVYIDLIDDNNQAVVTIKNVANYEINFSEEEILERFVRGDKARSTEGSGLGLSIAQSFTQACGGRFKIKIDGDLFKVELSFDIAKE